MNTPKFNQPLIAERISFKEFKDSVNMIKGQTGFVFLFHPLLSGYKYYTIIKGTKQLPALRAAYYLLFCYTDLNSEDINDYVKVADNEDFGFKIPLRFSTAFAFNAKQFENKEWFDICTNIPPKNMLESKEPDDKLTIKEALELLSPHLENRKKRVHSFVGTGIALFGCDIDLTSVKQYFKNSDEIVLAGPNMRSMSHGVAFYEEGSGYTFLETDKVKLEAKLKEINIW